MKPLNKFSRAERGVVVIIGTYLFTLLLVSSIIAYHGYYYDFSVGGFFTVMVVFGTPAVILGYGALWVLRAPKKKKQSKDEE